MPQFQFKNGKTLDFEEFPIKQENLRKVNIYDEGKDGEGVWAAFSDEGLKLYDDPRGRTAEYAGVCILQNSPLNFYPMNGWGAYIPVKFNGASRPSMDVADMTGKMIFCKERIEQEAASAAKEKEKQ